jgi:hypothetical protein
MCCWWLHHTHAVRSPSNARCARSSCFHITSIAVVTVPEQDHWGSIPTPVNGRSPLLVILSSTLTPIIHPLKSQSSQAGIAKGRLCGFYSRYDGHDTLPISNMYSIFTLHLSLVSGISFFLPPLSILIAFEHKRRCSALLSCRHAQEEGACRI